MVYKWFPDAAAGILICLVYVALFSAASRWQKRLPATLELLLTPAGFALRLLIVLLSIDWLVSALKLSLIYTTAGFLITHTIWLAFLLLTEIFKNERQIADLKEYR